MSSHHRIRRAFYTTHNKKLRPFIWPQSPQPFPYTVFALYVTGAVEAAKTSLPTVEKPGRPQPNRQAGDTEGL
jgi:hypothetical protein